jgi:pilus assembly protein Flp/PilA
LIPPTVKGILCDGRYAGIGSTQRLPCRDFLTSQTKENIGMKINILEVFSKIQLLVLRQDGQDLIEYALVVALIAFAATAGMNSLAVDINNAFLTIGNTLNNSL